MFLNMDTITDYVTVLFIDISLSQYVIRFIPRRVQEFVPEATQALKHLLLLKHEIKCMWHIQPHAGYSTKFDVEISLL